MFNQSPKVALVAVVNIYTIKIILINIIIETTTIFPSRVTAEQGGRLHTIIVGLVYMNCLMVVVGSVVVVVEVVVVVVVVVVGVVGHCDGRDVLVAMLEHI